MVGVDRQLTDKDVLRVAEQIVPGYAFRIAIEYLELDKVEFDLMRANCDRRGAPVKEYHFDILMKWKIKKGSQATKEALHECLQKAAEAGLIEKSKIGFLAEAVSYATSFY